MKIRQAKPEDYEFFKRIIKESLFPIISKYMEPDINVVRERFKRDYKNIKIVMDGKKRIGFYHIVSQGNNLKLNKIFISKAYRGKGFGKELMKRFENKNYKKIALEIWDNNPAINFYKKIGYKQINKKNHKIHMEKFLK